MPNDPPSRIDPVVVFTVALADGAHHKQTCSPSQPDQDRLKILQMHCKAETDTAPRIFSSPFYSIYIYMTYTNFLIINYFKYSAVPM